MVSSVASLTGWRREGQWVRGEREGGEGEKRERTDAFDGGGFGVELGLGCHCGDGVGVSGLDGIGCGWKLGEC